MNICSFRYHLYKSKASQGLDHENTHNREAGSHPSPQAAALQPTPDIPNKGIDVDTPDKNHSSSQSMHFDIRFNPDIFLPGAWVSE